MKIYVKDEALVVKRKRKKYNKSIFGGRLMVGQWPLKPLILGSSPSPRATLSVAKVR